MDTGKLFYTIPEAAHILGISRSKLYVLIDAGELTRVHIASSARIPAESIREFHDRLLAAAASESTEGDASAA